MHVHVGGPDGEAKFWIEPNITIAENHGVALHELTVIQGIIEKHEQDIRNAWRRHFGS
jgi:hypothetical protein